MTNPSSPLFDQVIEVLKKKHSHSFFYRPEDPSKLAAQHQLLKDLSDLFHQKPLTTREELNNFITNAESYKMSSRQVQNDLLHVINRVIEPSQQSVTPQKR